MDFLAVAILVALLLDLLLGDPQWMPHPVRWIGKASDWLEPILIRSLGASKIGGVIFTFLVVGATYLLSWGLVWGSFQIHFWCGVGISTLLLYTCFAAYDLDKQSRKVYNKIKRGNLDQARIQLSMMVGRDTMSLNEEDISRATVETVAENTVDGILSPLFFAVIGGAPFALAFKAASTLDSMVGHQNEKSREFGWASAQLDQWLNFIPARLAQLLYPFAALICRLNALDCWRIAWRDSRKSPSLNSGISEAAFAGALQVQLGGEDRYPGETQMRPLLGDPLQELTADKIPQAINLMYFTTALMAILLISIRLIISQN